jgi:HEAT repeat protein
MSFYEDLPVELQVMVLHGFTEKQLFDLIQGKIGEEAQLPLPPVDELRVELFRRRGKEASRYQSALLVSWLRYWARNNQLPFIKTAVDRHAWIKLFDAALCDLESSYEHKIRCCLLINALYPNVQDLTPSILEFLQAKNKDSYLAREIRAFSASLSRENFQGMLSNLSFQLGSNQSSDREAASQVLGGIAPLLSKEALESMAASLRDNLNKDGFNNYLIRAGSVMGLSALMPYLSSETRNITFRLLKGRSDMDVVREEAMKALGTMSPYLTQDQKDEVFRVSYDQLNHTDGYTREDAVKALGYFAAHVRQERRQEMVDLLLAKLDQDPLSSVQCKAVDALTRIVSSLSTEETEALWPRLFNKLNDTNLSVKEKAVDAIAVLAPRVSEVVRAQMLAFILDIINTPGREVSLIPDLALKALVRSLPQAECEAQISALLIRQENQPIYSDVIVITLSSMAHYASKSQRDQLWTLFVRKIETNELSMALREALLGLTRMAPKFTMKQADDLVTIALNQLRWGVWILPHAAFKLLGAIALCASEAKLAEIFAPLLGGLSHYEQEVRQAAAQALMAWIPRLSLSQLHELLALPSEGHPQKMILKLMAQTRLHLYQPQSEPAKDLGVYFVRKDSGQLHQRRFDSETQTWGEPRTLRLWSQVGGKSQTVDDCIKEVTTRPKINHEWM